MGRTPERPPPLTELKSTVKERVVCEMQEQSSTCGKLWIIFKYTLRRGRPAAGGIAAAGADLCYDVLFPRVLLRPYGAAGRCARDPGPFAVDRISSNAAAGTRSSRSRAARVLDLGPATRGGLTATAVKFGRIYRGFHLSRQAASYCPRPKFRPCVGRKRPDRAHRMPPRASGKRAGTTEWAAHRPSRKYARFKLGSNALPSVLGRELINARGRTTSESPLHPEGDRQ
jgi:hypothetical protein